MREPAPSMAELRKRIVGDSVERQKWLTTLLKMVRETERAATIDRLAHARDEGVEK